MEATQAVAITGLSCKFPGDGDNLDNFWESICLGKSAWSKVPRERFNVDAFWSSSKNRNTTVTQGAHFLKDDISKFDANFFSIPKNDVEAMDPQQRIMVEVAYEALEKAGLRLDRISGTKTGVFMGHFTSDYKEMIYRDPDNAPLYSITGSCKTSLANRISWLWDLRGPSISVDTACSSSLVALHLACQSLRTGDSDIAIVGGTSLLLNPEMFLYLSNQAFLSPDGKCKSFDQSANGYGRGEGFGCVVLKRVDDAIAGADPIRAVIRGTGSNQDGHTKGFTLPSADAQSALIEDTYRRAGVDMRETGYVEAHGTGTQAGDVQEMEALSRTIARCHTADCRLLVGSVKSNIGHLEAAAGVAGIIKAVLILETGLIPPSIHFRKGNAKIRFDEWNIGVPQDLTPWPRKGVRRISTNSFGYGGTNAHAILEDADHYLKEFHKSISTNGQVVNDTNENVMNDNSNGRYEVDDRAVPHLFVISAQDKDGLKRVKMSLTKFIERKVIEVESWTQKPDVFMSELAYTLSERRTRLQWKTFVISSSPEELCTALQDEASATLVAQSSRSPRLGFVFTGQGAQWPKMGIELMVYKSFKESVMAADRYLREECECLWSVTTELHKAKSTSQLHLAEFSQSLCTVLQVALVDLLKTWNIFPKAVVGHSSGEIAAAYCMGALTREDAWRIAYYRGLLSSELKSIAPQLDGSMMVVGLSREKAEEWISKVSDGHVVVACINAPTSITMSGDAQGIDQLLGLLKEKGVFARKLQVDTAYHSPHMQAVAQEYYELLADVTTLRAGSDCTMHSSVTGFSIEANHLGAVNWVRNLTSPVLFTNAIHDMLRPMKGKKRVEENAVDLLIEIGPHFALRGPCTQSLEANGIANVPYYSLLARNENAMETALYLAGVLFALGAPVEMRRVNIGCNKHFAKPLVDLPSYPWNHSQGYWHESRVEKEYLFRNKSKLSLLGAPGPVFGDGERLWRGFMRASEEPWIEDHKIQGSILYPGAGFLAMALEAAHQTADHTQQIAAYKLRDVEFTSAAIFNDGCDLEFIVQLRPHISGTKNLSATWTEFVVTSSPDGESLVKNCYGLIVIEYESAGDAHMRNEKDCEARTLRDRYVEAKELCRAQVTPQDFYTDLAFLGFNYGPAFTNLSNIRNREGQSVCTLQIPETHVESLDGSERPHIIHPRVLDAVFHLGFAAAKGTEGELTTTMVPKSLDEVVISAKVPFKPGSRLLGYSNSDRHGFKDLASDIVMFDEVNHLPVIQIDRLFCAEIAGSRTGSDVGARSLTSKLIWRPAINLLTSEEQVMLFDCWKGLDKIGEYLRLIHHSHPSLDILEIIPGRQDSDSIVLSTNLNGLDQVLKTGSLTILCQDVAIKEKLATDHKHKDSAALELLDFSQRTLTETLSDGVYDIMVTTDLAENAQMTDDTVASMVRSLKKGGSMCVLGLEDRIRTTHDYLQKYQMKTVTRQIVEDTQLGHLCLMIARKVELPLANGIPGIPDPENVIIIQMTNPSVAAQTVASNIATSLERAGHTTTQFFWGSDTSLISGKSCISLVELDQLLFVDMSKDDFTSIQRLVLEASQILWVVGRGDPGAAMVDGLARVVRNEIPRLSFRTMHAENEYHSSNLSLGNLIGRVFLSGSQDDEFLVKDHLLHVSRIIEDERFNEQINDLLPGTRERLSRSPLGQIQYPTKLCVQNPGLLDSLCLERDDLPGSELEEDFIEIRVKATALNFREVMVAMGQIADSKLGLDAAGIVHRVGSAVSKFKVGDRVAMYGHGSHRTHHRSRADYCALIPNGLSFEQAASIPTVHGTAWNALVRLAKVQKGQSILIHAAAGGVGQAAIQIAKHYGMEIFATVSSEAKRRLIQDQYDIPDDHIFNSRDLSFVKGVKRMTSSRGVDVVLNSLSGEFLRQTWHCIAPFGYFIEIGLKDIVSNTGLDMRPFIQDATFSFFNLTHIEINRPEIMAAIIEGAFDFQRRGITKPIEPLVTFPISDVEEAFRLMQTGKHVGKIALTWHNDHVVSFIPKTRSTMKLDPSAVYMLAGGLGGLGRSLAMKLVDLGARKLCFVSRSGGDSAPRTKLAQDLAELDVKTRIYKCDITNGKVLASSIDKCRSELGDIRGVFQCAMVLRDSVFANMSYDQWAECTRPKVQGSWNLHQQLPDVDFHITLSSFAAIFGNRGQSNYAAAGAYEDALAYHRRALGQHAITVDLGIMRDIGVLTEIEIQGALRDWEKPYGIREREFHVLMEQVIAGDVANSTLPQVLTGLATGGSSIAADIEPPYYLKDARFSIMAATGIRGHQVHGGGGHSIAPHTLIAQAKSLEEAGGYVLQALREVVAKMLQTTASEIDASRFLHMYGIDSLVAIEIINWAFKEVKSVVTVIEVLASVPISTLANKMVAKSSALPEELAR